MEYLLSVMLMILANLKTLDQVGPPVSCVNCMLLSIQNLQTFGSVFLTVIYQYLTVKLMSRRVD